METVSQNISMNKKLLFKVLIIGIIILVLQMPAMYVQGLVTERESRQKEAINEVSSKWSGKQNLAGPILVLPYWKADNDSVKNKSLHKHYAYFLPDELRIQSSLYPQERHR